MEEMISKVIEYGKDGKGRIVHITDIEFDSNFSPIYVLKLMDISECNQKCSIGSKLDSIEDFKENAKCVAELRFYNRESIQILIKSLNELCSPQLYDAC